MRQHLHVDAGRVHLGDAALPDIIETRGNLGLPRDVGTSDVGFYLGIEIMLLEGDDLGLCRHFLLPAIGWLFVSASTGAVRPIHRSRVPARPAATMRHRPAAARPLPE